MVWWYSFNDIPQEIRMEGNPPHQISFSSWVNRSTFNFTQKQVTSSFSNLYFSYTDRQAGLSIIVYMSVCVWERKRGESLCNIFLIKYASPSEGSFSKLAESTNQYK